MKAKKKRDKKYVPKVVAKPLGIRDNLKLEMPALQALEALGREHFVEQHVYDLLSCADLVKRTTPLDDPIRLQAQEVVYAVADIQARNLRNGRPGVTGDEMRVLRENVGKLVAYLRGVPNVEICRASQAALKEFNRHGALRV